MVEKQQRIDFTRGEKLGILDRLKLPDRIEIVGPRGGRSSVSGCACVNVLKVIEGFCGSSDSCVVRIGKISMSTRLKEATVKRALTGLRDRYLIDVQMRNGPNGRLASEYRPIWGNLIELAEDPKAHGAQPKAHGAQPKAHGAQPKAHGAQPKAHGELGRVTGPEYPSGITGPDRIRSGPEDLDFETDAGRTVKASESNGAAVPEWPELRQFAGRTVKASEPESLRMGIFRPVKLAHLQSTEAVVEWFCRQLAAESPATGASYAELVLVMAAARRAVAMPENQVRKSRVAVFVGIVSRHKWDGCRPWIAEAIERLRRYRENGGTRLVEVQPEKV